MASFLTSRSGTDRPNPNTAGAVPGRNDERRDERRLRERDRDASARPFGASQARPNRKRPGPSILGSIAVWAIRTGKDQAHAERFGIFIGLWAPTFMIIGSKLHMEESNKGLASPQLQAISDQAEGTADESRRRVDQAASR